MLPLVILALTFLMGFPNTSRYNASPPTLPLPTPINQVAQRGVLTWSPFGPRENYTLFKVYSDPSTMFLDFLFGALDLADYPVRQGDLTTFQQSPDFFVT